MGINWHITLGYNSGYTGEADWNKVCEIARELASQPDYIFQSALDAEPTDSLVDKLAEVAETYQAEKGNPLVIEKDSIDILASGGGEYREAKEHIARGFIRELLERVHTLGFDINIHTG